MIIVNGFQPLDVDVAAALDPPLTVIYLYRPALCYYHFLTQQANTCLESAKELLEKVNNKEIYAFSVNIQHVSHRFLVFLLLILKRQLFAR